MATQPTTIDGEVWRDIPGTEGNYQVSNLGRARRIRILRPVNHSAGRLVITTFVNGNGRVKLLNRVVCEAFHGPPPEGAHAAHLNGSPHDNRAENLIWASPKENMSHKLLHGTHNQGEQHNFAKLTEENVAEIRSRKLTIEEKRSLAERLGVKCCTIDDVISRRSWAHIP